MLARLLILVMLLPVLEIGVLIWLATETSIWVVLALLIGAGFLGAFLARQQGLRAMTRVREEIARGRMPADALSDAVLVSLAGVLLILPGLISDVIAILLLFPPSRRLIKSLARRGFRGRVVTSTYTTFDAVSTPARDEVIDVRVIESPAPKS